MGVELIRLFLQQASAQGSKSTALSPLGWISAIVVSALLGCVGFHGPTWLLVFLAALLAACLAAYLWAYAHFAKANPDALRSERYTLRKMEIDRSIRGDSEAGFGAAPLPGGAVVDVATLPAPASGPDLDKD